MPKKPPAKTEPTVASALRGEGSPSMALFTPLLRAVTRQSPRNGVAVEPKKTCVHLNAGKNGPAFLGVHPRANGLLLTVISDAPIKSDRVRKTVRASARRCYNDMVIESAQEIDAELLGWIAASHSLLIKPR